VIDAVTRLKSRGWAIRVLAAGLYIGIAVWGTHHLRAKNANDLDAAYEVLRPLPKGHRIRAGDLRPSALLPSHLRATLSSLPSPLGRYLVAKSLRGSLIGTKMLADSPPMTIKKDNLGLPFTVPAPLVSTGFLDVDTKVSLCSTKCELSNVRIAATLCDPGASVCTTILELTKTQAEVFAVHFADTRLVFDASLSQANPQEDTPKDQYAQTEF
jgi:hypothetical protein